MALTIPRSLLIDQLQTAFASIGQGPILLHSDIFRIGIIDHVKDRQSICADYEQVIQQVLGARTLLIPTFNYDFCRDGIYDVQNSPSQVGALTDYYRCQGYPRTRTPVFNFCVVNNQGFSLREVENCFGVASTFGELVRQDAVIVFLGAPLSSITFLHHVEEVNDISYRFHKVFEGVVVDAGVRTAVKLVYRVRPLDPPDAVVYDWARLQADLEDSGFLRRYSVGNGVLLVLRAREVLAHWSASIQEKERYLLLPDRDA